MSLIYKNIVDQIIKITKVNSKNAEKIVFHLLQNINDSSEKLNELQKTIKNVKKCVFCNALTKNEICDRCQNGNEQLILVKNYSEYANIQKNTTNQRIFLFENYKEILKSKNHIEIKKIIDYIEKFSIKEIIFSFSPTFETEIVYNFFKEEILRSIRNIKITKIAIGLPYGGLIDYVDEKTYEEAFKQRK